MRKALIPAVIVLLAALSVPAAAIAPECCEATVDVYLTIMPYCCVQLDCDFIEVVIDEESCQGPGPFSGCGCCPVWACANFDALLDCVLNMDPGAPGTWSCLIAGAPGPIPFGPGQFSCLVEVCVDDIMCDDYAREMEWVGTLTVLVCPSII